MTSNLNLDWALARVKEYRVAGPKGGRMPYQRAMLAMADEIDRLEALKSAFAHDAAMYGAKLADVETTTVQAPQGVRPEPADGSAGTTLASNKQCPHCTGLIPAACKCDCDENDMYCPHMGVAEKAKVRHAVTYKMFPDPYDEREPAGPCTCGALKAASDGCRYPMSYGSRCAAYPDCVCGRSSEKSNEAKVS